MSQATGDEEFRPLDITEQDAYEAMAEIPGYLDITPADFKESKNVNRVPVIDDAGSLCGIVSRGDIVRRLGFRG